MKLILFLAALFSIHCIPVIHPVIFAYGAGIGIQRQRQQELQKKQARLLTITHKFSTPSITINKDNLEKFKQLKQEFQNQ